MDLDGDGFLACHDFLYSLGKNLLGAGDVLPNSLGQFLKFSGPLCLDTFHIGILEKLDIDFFQLLVIFGLHLKHFLLGDVPAEVGVHDPLFSALQVCLTGLKTTAAFPLGRVCQDVLYIGGQLLGQSIVVQVKLLEDELDAGSEGFVVEYPHAAAHIITLAVLLSVSIVGPAVAFPDLIGVSIAAMGDFGDKPGIAGAVADLAGTPIAAGIFAFGWSKN